MGVSKNNGIPKSSILIGVSIIFTIHFGVKPPIFGSTPKLPLFRLKNIIFKPRLSWFKRQVVAAPRCRGKNAPYEPHDLVSGARGSGYARPAMLPEQGPVMLGPVVFEGRTVVLKM